MAPQTKTVPVSKQFAGIHNPAGCMPGGPKAVNVNGTGGFTIPTKFFNQPWPGGTMGGTAKNLQVTPVPNVPNILQLATSFQFTGPQNNAITAMHTFGPWFEKKNPVVKSAMYAPWRVFKKSAWMSQTGRAGKTFTACGGTVANLACTKPSQGAVPAILKNFGGANGFGGTIGLVITTSPTQASSLAIKIGAMSTVGFNLVGGMGSRAAGRGYAAYDTDFLAAGDIYLMYMLTTKNTPNYALIKSVMTKVGMFPTARTRTGASRSPRVRSSPAVLARRSAAWSAVGGTLTAKGFDKAATMLTGIGVPVPGGRQLQLVAGGVAQSNIQGPNGTPNYTVIRLPEPGRSLQMLAGVAGLLAIAVWRGRKAR
jgi:hypothetical protein